MDKSSSRRSLELTMLYEAVANRHLQYENLLWQVPALSLTAQAFLFSISMSAGNDPVARIASSLLALIVSIISIMLMASHRLAGRRDALWLERFEQGELSAGNLGVHGHAFEKQQDIADLDAGWVGKLIPMRQMFTVWVVGLSCFAIAAIFMILRTLINGAR
ncbi:protein-S-isoprenylcysteine O-methyltransferase Ste14 [Nocardia sp. GAS34]|uniref:hypothetical protein n=1 Tax=unclassified Nocardia TaxID=2637762 RepID=UPI003D238655